MRPPPPGWSRINASLFYDDAKAAIDFLCTAFGFEPVLIIERDDGAIQHSELRLGETGLIMVGSAAAAHDIPSASPRSLDGRVSQAQCIFVDDADAHAAAAEAAGAVIVCAPETHDYGEEHWADRTYLARDPEGHHWWFMQRLRGPGA
ncbi:MAG: VOC family protein [Myxococcales bacterium]|nr:VOC family protein [Myxococcales bacterium]